MKMCAVVKIDDISLEKESSMLSYWDENLR